MGTGAITQYIDVAQLALYLFWLFFFGLVWYLHRENKREGYPLVDSHNADYAAEGFPGVPEPKTFVLPNNQGTRVAPRKDQQYELAAVPVNAAPGFPLHPTGNPMKDGVGPAAWAIRPEKPDLTWEGTPRIIPMRSAEGWAIPSRDPDPRGRPVYGVDGEEGGTVTDLWIDLAEPFVRYLEIDAGGRRVLMPMTLAKVRSNGDVHAKSVCGRHFADAPGTASPEQVTLQEEDKISAYFAGGYLYALGERTEPWL
jgi:photosynthetic reaction center H subunit